jgi:hypothetical protein
LAGRVAACAVAIFVAACTGARQASELPVAATPVRASRPTAASFRYHPRSAAPMLASVELEGGAVLWAGRRGERWLFEPKTNRFAAALPAPEDLVAVTTDPGGGHWFVGRSGASYHATTPLGSFVDVTVPLEPLAQVSAAGRTLLGVGRDERLSRSTDDGRSWTPAGPVDTSFVDVAIDAHDHVLALASPEAIWQSDDGGASFRPSGLPVSGALSLVPEPNGDGIHVITLLGSSHFGAATNSAAKPVPLFEDVVRRGVALPLGEDAGSLADDSAAVSEGTYLELRAVGDGKREWELVSGAFGGPLAARPLAEAKGCAAVKLASFERWAYFACFRATPASTQRVELYASTDGGRVFARVAPDFWARLARFRLAVGRAGTLLLSGACPPSVEGPGCAPSGILYRRAVPTERAPKDAGAPKDAEAQAEAGFELALAAVPSLAEGGTVELAFDPEGRHAFALGASTKGTTLSLFVSKDAGQSFEPNDLGDTTRDQDLDLGAPLTPGRDGTLSLVLGGRRSTPSLVVVDADGRVLHAGAPPERVLLGAAGLSALAVVADTGAVLESLDGGVTWLPRGKLPVPPCPGDGNCDVPVACSSDGCVIGDDFTRVGWGASDEAALESYSPVDADGETGLERRLRTPVACTLAQGGWHALPGVHELPDADQAAIGDAAWFALADEGASGGVRVHHGRGGPHPRVDAVELFPALAHPAEYAQNVTAQIEGAAVLRYRVPEGHASSGRLRDVELAWDNLFEGRVGRARLADGGLYTPGDFERAGSGVQSAKPDLVSIAERGIYLRVHARTRADQPTYFLDGTSSVQVAPITWPATIPRGAHGEMAHLGASHVGLMLLARGGAFARARLSGDAWSFDAASVGLPDPDAFGVAQLIDITYLKGQAALHVEKLDERGRRAEAHLFALNSEGPAAGPPVAVPTELDLPTTPVACTPAERAATSRLVARGYPGARHPIVVSDAVEPPRAMLSGDAVLYGTKAAPCAAAFELHPVPGGAPDPAATESGLLLLDDPTHAWLFRRSRESGGEGTHVEYRSMSCRFEPNLELPEEILNAPEALAPKR